MDNILSKLQIRVSNKIYLKNPEGTVLGKSIIRGSIEMIDEIGFEEFTFRKLAIEIESTEASIYRYFESKHKLLLYLISWYWGWMECRLVFGMANLDSPKDRLERAIRILTERVEQDGDFEHINEVKLNRIVISESSKVYLTKDVDQENKEGIFIAYKQLVSRVSDVIMEINPKYKYPRMLTSNFIEGAHHQRYFAEHLPGLTDVVKGKDAVTDFYINLVFYSISK